MHLLTMLLIKESSTVALYGLDAFICASKINIPKIIVVAVKTPLLLTTDAKPHYCLTTHLHCKAFSGLYPSSTHHSWLYASSVQGGLYFCC